MLNALQMLSHLIPRKIFLAALSLTTCHSYFQSWKAASLSSVPKDTQGVTSGSDFLLPWVLLSAVKTDFPGRCPAKLWGGGANLFWPSDSFLHALPSRKEYSRFWGESIVSPFSFLFSLFRDTVFLTLTPQLTDWSSDCRRGWLVSGLVSPASSAFGSCCLAHLSCPPPPLGIRAASSSWIATYLRVEVVSFWSQRAHQSLG